MIFNSSSYDNKNSATPLVSLKKIPTEKEFFELCKRRRRHHQTTKSSNVTTAEVLLRILLLSGDIEVNPGPWTCDICSQNFKHQQKFDNHITNRETVSCCHCTQIFCNRRQCQLHERTCPNRPSTSGQHNPASWTCTRCSQIFKHRQRYDTHLANQETVSCRFCETNFCSTQKCYSHERTCPARHTNHPERIEQLDSESWKCTRCDQNFDRYQR